MNDVKSLNGTGKFMVSTYDPREPRRASFAESSAAFGDGRDTSRKYLERCLATIDAREPVVRAWAYLNIEGARSQADASTQRWKTGRSLSPIDGLPIGVKDLIETVDMPTASGCRALVGNFTKRDNAGVAALRQAGATVLGKTVTTEFGGPSPSVTTNPFHSAHTPGGSSSGSGAVVGADMVPAAIGSQTGGSMIRPASYCANYALKPSQGAINRGERLIPCTSTHGPHAGSLEDMWSVAIEIVRRVGGDPGYSPLFGPDTLPKSHRPLRLAVMETTGYAELSPAAASAFDAVLSQIADAGVEIVRRTQDKILEEFERALVGTSKLMVDMLSWELQWTMRNVLSSTGDPNALSDFGKALIERGERLGADGYADSLRQRAVISNAFVAMRNRVDAFIAPSSKGSAPRIDEGALLEPGQGFPTGDPIFNTPSSLVGACVVTSPLTSVDGLPMGIQVMGQHGSDARIVAIANWLREAIRPVVA